MTRGREQAQPEQWGVWEIGGPTPTLSPEQLKKGINRAESGLKNATDYVETDVSYAASRIKDRIRKVAIVLAEIGAFPTEDVIIEGQKTTAPILRSDMIGTYLATDGILRTYTHAAGEHAGLPVLGEETPTDMEVINARGIWIGSLRRSLDEFKNANSPEPTNDTVTGTTEQP